MSLAIDPDKVEAVLLADGWHEITYFSLDSYEFVEPGESGGSFVLHGGGQSGVCATGFVFREGSFAYYGPLTAILAVRTEPIR